MEAKGLAALILAAVFASCDSAPQRTAQRPMPSPSSAHRYHCGPSIFDPAIMEAPAPESGDPNVQDLVASLQRSNPAKGSWRVVSDDGERVGLMARRRRDYAYALFERSGDNWTPDELSSCTPEVVIGRRAPVYWELAVEPAPSDTELTVMATEPSCQGDRKLTQRNTRFDLEYAGDAITIVGTTRPQVGGECIGREWRLRVRLDEPVGDRALLDAVVCLSAGTPVSVNGRERGGRTNRPPLAPSVRHLARRSPIRRGYAASCASSRR